MAEHSGRRSQLVLIASPLQGHMTPMLQLASYLHSKGFPITIAHSEFNPPDPSKHPDFIFLPLPDNLSGTGTPSGIVQFLRTLNDNCKPHLEKHLIHMINTQKETSEKESIVIIHDNLMFFAGSLAGDLGLPSIILRSSCAAFVPAYKIIPQLHQEGRFPTQDKQSPKSVIYVSLGSLATIDAKVSTEMAWGLANSNQHFLWVVRPGSVQGCDWIEFLPEGLLSEMKARGLIVKWAPQKDVLAHDAVGGFWSHCGWNSTLESVCEGVPMLCQPFNIDQMLNARYLSYVWKMGLEIVVERGEIESAIRRVMASKEGEEMRCRALEIEEQVKVAVSHDGASQNSMNDLVEFILSL
ncbi:hypothetical protein L1887_45913 [Cichorium endivia]|nr:hypothetical protein L1887_45913 [Cichorium endivia]